MSTRVRFQGTEYWLLIEPGEDHGPLAPLNHCDQDGKLFPDSALFDTSFAYLRRDGALMRHGEIIGTKLDLETVSVARPS